MTTSAITIESPVVDNVARSTTAAALTFNTQKQQHGTITSTSGGGGGVWIGIDFGTSNCACAVWDSTRGRPKWMRLKHATPERSGKVGRIVPSVVMLLMPESERRIDSDDEYYSLDGTTNLQTLVGYAAVQEPQSNASRDNEGSQEQEQTQQQQNQQVLIRSVKRLLGITRKQDLDADWIQSLPFDLIEQDEELRIAMPNGTTTIPPVDIVTVLLRSIRCDAQHYLQRHLKKKKMNVPGGGDDDDDDDDATTSRSMEVLHCVVGVPAYFSQRQCALLEQACHRAGFTGHVSTVVESTAAAMAYGLFVGHNNNNNNNKKRILVLDMGGGTTDITIADMNAPTKEENQDDDDDDDEAQPSFTVMVTEGDHRLGGDDMDQALYQWVLGKLNQQPQQQETTMNRTERTLLLRECRRVKEYLCGDGQDGTHPDSCTLHYHDSNGKMSRRMEVSYQEFITSIAPLLERVDQLVRSALLQYKSKCADDSINDSSTSSQRRDPLPATTVDEVVLVGGGTRVPAVRALLRDIFAPLELCLSVNAMSAVAEGAAIQAAIQSHLVPSHELQSALMLDTLPHAIGIAVVTTLAPGDNDDSNVENNDPQPHQHEKGEQETFVEILPKDAPLPAFGSAIFTLARVDQPGITIQAVEKVGSKFPLQKIQDFTFLLHRLTAQQLQTMTCRTIEIQIRMEMDGKLVVSYFDPNDPEHQRREKQKKQRSIEKESNSSNNHLTFDKTTEPEVTTSEQIVLIVACAVLFVVYVVVKLMFHVPEEKSQIV